MTALELRLQEVRVSTGGEPPLVVLREAKGERLLPIWTNFDGVTAIVAATEAAKTEVITMHELLRDLLAIHGHRVEAVRLTGFEDGRFFAEITVSGKTLLLRPTDAIAMSVLTGCTIHCAAEVLDAAGVHPEPLEEVARFREFLDSVDPTDFE
ncbi:MAG: bifunctional nuclease family protein [Propionibacteriaceae bacterium]|jgi:bifunctional DNase/RNase|nr:bifunctional nuclease family protein [Propionibacteriaceae bacterium]